MKQRVGFWGLAASVVAAGMMMSAAAQAAVPASGRLDFTVLRDGKEIGRHELVFHKDGDGVNIDIHTDIAVKVLFVTAYRFQHEGHETWKDGQLVRLTSSTNDDGTKHVLNVAANGKGLDIVGDGQKSLGDAALIPASLWHEGIVSSDAILNTLDGRQMAITVKDAGMESVTVKGQEVEAHHFVISGDLERELWFDANDVLVKVRFKGKDDSGIEYVLR